MDKVTKVESWDKATIVSTPSVSGYTYCFLNFSGEIIGLNRFFRRSSDEFSGFKPG